jgi:hypothetical protein
MDHDGRRRPFGLIVHHTDAEREYAYDRNTSFGRLDKALDAAVLNKWTVVDEERPETHLSVRIEFVLKRRATTLCRQVFLRQLAETCGSQFSSDV